MALTYTPEPEIGKPCPDFTLPAVDGKNYSLNDFQDSKGLVVMFICNHCPYVQAIEDRLISLSKEYIEKGIPFIGICSNDSQNYPDDSFENLAKRSKEKGFPFVYLHDESQSVAKAFGAVCTPDFFVYDRNKVLVYRGRLDDSWKEPDKVKHQDLRNALDSILNSEPVSKDQIPSMGCSIKWV